MKCCRLQQHRQIHFGTHGIQQLQHFNNLTGAGGLLASIPADEIKIKRSIFSECFLAKPAAITPPTQNSELR